MATPNPDNNHQQQLENQFYSKGAEYWSEIPATVDGMLGGFGHISQTDIRDSKLLLKQLFGSQKPPGRDYALDCGAGIGRISKHLLTGLFARVDLVEQNATFLEQARRYLGDGLQDRIGEYYSVGLQYFRPEPHKYDVIWIQWVLGHLTEQDLVNFLKSCQSGLKPNGVIIIKENTSSSEEIDTDEMDSSITRPLALFRKIFTDAGLNCYRQVKQRSFPKGLYTVYMFVLKPLNYINSPSTESTSNNIAEKNEIIDCCKTLVTKLEDLKCDNNVVPE